MFHMNKWLEKLQLPRLHFIRLVDGERNHVGEERRKLPRNLCHERQLPIKSFARGPQEAIPVQGFPFLDEEDIDRLH